MVTFDAPLKDNKRPRCACALVLDHSDSMRGDRIASLNAALRKFPPMLLADELIRKQAELAAIGFPSPRILQPFGPIDDFVPPVLTPGGTTPLGAAVRLALSAIEARKAEYRENRLQYFRPILIIMTDGAPDPDDDWRGAAAEVVAAEKAGKVACFPVAVGDADSAVLGAFSNRPVASLVGLNFAGLFEWLASTIKAVSHSDTQSSSDAAPRAAMSRSPSRRTRCSRGTLFDRDRPVVADRSVVGRRPRALGPQHALPGLF